MMNPDLCSLESDPEPRFLDADSKNRKKTPYTYIYIYLENRLFLPSPWNMKKHSGLPVSSGTTTRTVGSKGIVSIIYICVEDTSSTLSKIM